jgi:Family of unknown function (DUF5305)
VSYLVGLVGSIDAELNYTAPSFTVNFVESATGSVAVGARGTPVVLGSWLNLTFRGALIVPSGDPATAHGTVTGADGPASPDTGAVVVAWLELAAALGALLVSAWLFWTTRSVAGPGAIPNLDRLIEPYDEVIAQTAPVPDGLKALPVDRWEDLVKVADTLGRPILRPVQPKGDLPGSDFYVFDGTTAYVYRHPGSSAATPGPGVGASSGIGVPQVVPQAPATPSPVSPTATGIPAVPPPKRLRNAAAKRLAAELEAELRRVRTGSFDPVQRWYLYSLATLAVRKVADGDAGEARPYVEELRRAIDKSLDGPRPPA